ncbi:MAG: CHAT domain-containing protein [Terracidiphilus sp.]|jgi:hypothetical protein
MQEICIYVPANKWEVSVLRVDRDAAGVPADTLVAGPLPIDPALFAAGAALDPATVRGVFTAGKDSPQFAKFGRELMAALGIADSLWASIRAIKDDLRVYLRIEHPALSQFPWEVLTHQVYPLFIKSACLHVKHWPLPATAVNPVWPIRVFVINAVDPADTDLGAEEEVWKIRRALRAADHSIDLEILNTGNDQNFTAGNLKNLLTKVEKGVSTWPGGPHILHFIGHGVVDPEPMLKLYVQSIDAYVPFSRFQIAELMNSLPELRLVYLNACRSNNGASDPLAMTSISEVFLDSASAVVAMQADIRGKHAAACAGHFYDALSLGEDPAASIKAARQKLIAEYSEQSVAVYAPVLTTRVPVHQILARKQFPCDPQKERAWQDALKGPPYGPMDNWAHFVDQRPHRRNLYEALLGSNTGAPIVIHGESEVGKTWLMRWMSYPLALHGIRTLYAEGGPGVDWLELLRRLRDGSSAPYSPGLAEQLRCEFNWKINHFANGIVPPPGVPAGEADTAGSLVAMTAGNRLMNGFDELICEAMIHALREEAKVGPIVLVLDDLTLTSLSVLKKCFLDRLVNAADIRVVLCLEESYWAGVTLLGFETWRALPLSLIDPALARDLAREILRLKYGGRDITELEQFVTGVIKVPATIGSVFKTCTLAGLVGGY